ncbi:hypothetical protein JCM10212_000606 [Sporobolomyces blumeae]
MHPSTAVQAVAAILLGLPVFLPSVHAAVLPGNPQKKPTSRTKGKGPIQAEQWCTPSFSGLAQTITKSGKSEVAWKAVSASERGVMDGVKAANVGKGQLAAMELDLEWFVAPTSDGLFEITSGAAPSSCDVGFSPPNPLAQHALSPASPINSDCVAPHVFSVRCTSCDAHEDSASGCLLHSVSRDKCVELNDEGKLRWGECSDLLQDERGWIGKEERDVRKRRQTWDISP